MTDERPRRTEWQKRNANPSFSRDLMRERLTRGGVPEHIIESLLGEAQKESVEPSCTHEHHAMPVRGNDGIAVAMIDMHGNIPPMGDQIFLAHFWYALAKN